jgi:hypothetical protein
MSTEPRTQSVVIAAPKNVGLAVILTVLFGPLGMLYSMVIGGVIMLVASLILAVFTFGFGLLLTWPVCIVWGALAASSYNKNLMASAKRY